MKTIQKRVKFSQGEISPKLLERTDIDLLERSASYMKNYVSTNFGGFQTREGTIKVDEILNSLTPASVSFTSYIGGDVGDIGTLFISDALGTATNEILGDLSTVDDRESIKIKGIKLSFAEGSVSVSVGDTPPNENKIISPVIDVAGKGYKDITLNVIGDGTGAILTPTLGADGSIASVVVTDGGSGYTTATVEIIENDIWTDMQYVEISDDDITYSTVASFEATRTAQSFNYTVNVDYRYLRLRRGGTAITTCLEFTDIQLFDVIDANNKVRILPFIFGNNQKYVLILLDKTIKIYQDDQLLETIPADGLEEDYLEDIKFSQKDDVIVLTHPNMKTKELVRVGTGSDTDEIPEFAEGETSKDGFTLSGLGSSIALYKGVDGNSATYYSRGDLFNASSSTSNINEDYKVEFPVAQTISRITFKYSNYSNLRVYVKQSGVWNLIREDLTESFNNEKIFQDNIVREIEGIRITSDDVRENISETLVNIFTLRLFELNAFSTASSLFVFEDFPVENTPYYNFSGKVITPQTIGITPSAEEGAGEITADSSFFTSDSVGQYINTSEGSRFKITSYISGTKVSGYTVIPFLNTSKITSWDYETGYELAWSDERGYPSTCLFYQQRLWLGGSLNIPQSLWASRINEFNNFNNIGSYDNDSIDAPIASKTNDDIVNIFDNRGLQIFSSSKEFVANEDSLTPSNIFITPTTSDGSLRSVEPISVGGLTLFIEKNGNSIMSFVYNDVEASYKTAKLNLYSSHMLNNPTRMQVNVNTNVESSTYLYVAKQDGEMLSSCILLDQGINAFTRFITEGYVKDVMVLDTEVYLLVIRNDRLYLEKITDTKTDGTFIKAPAQTLTGLDAYEGDELRVYNEIDYGVYTVINGEITLSSVPTDNVNIGYDIDCELISNNVSVKSRTTSIYSRISKATITTEDTDKLTFNGYDLEQTDDIYDVYGAGTWTKENKFTITSKFDRVFVKSIELSINYGV